jgi:hypothetical protein
LFVVVTLVVILEGDLLLSLPLSLSVLVVVAVCPCRCKFLPSS